MVDYAKWDDLSDVSDDEDDGATICVRDCNGETAVYKHSELRTEQPWREQAPPPSAPLYSGPTPSLDPRPVLPVSTPTAGAPAATARAAAPAPTPDPAAGVAPPVSAATIPAGVAAQTLNNISTREGARPPSFTFDEARANGQTLFQAECKWVVQGHRLVTAGEECSSKKAAKADAALAMLRHCEQIGLLLFEQPAGKAAPE